MKTAPRTIAILGVLALLTLYFFPLWRITLVAPQYPDGVTMFIWIYQITGETEGTLQNINILNHYVGMKAIVPESIPELQYFPYIVAALALMGLVAAGINRKGMYLAWASVFLLLAILGIYDFYLWEYDYGNNLDPRAPIKVPGQSYQPPLFGTKMLLNFEASSYPGFGGWMMGLGLLLSFVSYGLRRRSTG